MIKPTPYVLSNDDAIFFYNFAVSKSKNDIKNRTEIARLAAKHGIKIEFLYNPCKTFSFSPDCIRIYGYSKGSKNEIFIQHLRNAFAHLNIEIAADRCRLLDWNAFTNGTRSNFKVSLITMMGDVSYESLCRLLEEFFSPDSLKKK